MIFSFVSSPFPKQEKQEKPIPPARLIVAFPSKLGPCEPRRVAISAPASPSFLWKPRKVQTKGCWVVRSIVFHSCKESINEGGWKNSHCGKSIHISNTYLRNTKSFKRKKLDRRLPRFDLLFDAGFLLLEDVSGVSETAKVTEALGWSCSFPSDMMLGRNILYDVSR